MAQFQYHPLPGRVATIVADGALADVYRRDPGYTEVLTDEQVEAMKGPELDAALAERRLPTGGRVAERRARLLGRADGEPLEEVLAQTPEPGVLPAGAEPEPEAPPTLAGAAAPHVAPGATDRDADPANPTTERAATDRDAKHAEES